MLASTIDHTLLAASASTEDIRRICAEARAWNFAAVCVNPIYVPLAVQELAGTAIPVCAVIGFPLGATTTTVKITEMVEALAAGAREIDVVAATGLLKSGDETGYQADLATLVTIAHQTPGIIVKAILEMGALTPAEKPHAALLAAEAGVDFVKTSTGMVAGGATVADVELLRATVPAHVQIKASGGIRLIEQAHAMLAAGATRLGTSSGGALMAAERSATES